MLKKFFNKVFTFIVVLFLTIGIVIPYNVKAADGSLSVAVSTSEIIVGNTFTVSVTLSYSKGISTSQFELKYDSNVCSYISGDADGTSYAGVIPIIYMPSDYPTSATWNFTFKANKVGTCNFSTNGVVFIDPDINTFSPSLGSASVKVLAEGSDDATLSSINISGASLSPEFAKWTLDYVCYVPYSVTSVDISAVASQGGQTVINGDPYNLAVGGNAVSITSYAPNGKTMTYNINIIRSEAPTEPPTEPPSTEPETEPETEAPTTDTVITVDDIKYTLNKYFPEDDMPKGYTSEVIKIDGTDIMAAVSSVTGLKLMYFTDEDGNGKIFIYYEDSKTFEKYIVFKSGDNTYVYLDISHADSAISDASQGECEIQGEKINAYISDADSDFVYFYAVNSKGERLWYCYDVQEKTIQRKNAAEGQASGNDIDSSETISQELQSLKDSYNKAVDDNKTLTKVRNIAFIAGGVVIIALIVIIVVMANHKSEKKHAIDIPDMDGDYGDEYAEAATDEALSGEELSAVILPEGLDSEDVLSDELELHEPLSEDSGEDAVLSEDAEPDESGTEDAATQEALPEDLEPDESLSDQQTGEMTDDSETSAEDELAVAVEEMTSDDIVVTKADMDSFEKEAEVLAQELAKQNEELTAQNGGNDELEPEIIDITSDIFDDKDNEPDIKSQGAVEPADKEQQETSESDIAESGEDSEDGEDTFL